MKCYHNFHVSFGHKKATSAHLTSKMLKPPETHWNQAKSLTFQADVYVGSMQYHTLYHILKQQSVKSVHFKNRVCPQIIQQAVPESGCIQTQSSLSTDVNCQAQVDKLS